MDSVIWKSAAPALSARLMFRSSSATEGLQSLLRSETNKACRHHPFPPCRAYLLEKKASQVCV